MRASKAIVAAVAAVGSILLAAGCSSSSSSSSASSPSSSAAGGGSSSASAAALGQREHRHLGRRLRRHETPSSPPPKEEGQLNVITLPSNWANYGAIMKAFTAKYGIKITDANPEGSSQDELNAIKQLKGQGSAPDVVDVGGSFADHRPDGRRLGALPGRDLERHPGRGQGRQRRTTTPTTAATWPSATTRPR